MFPFLSKGKNAWMPLITYIVSYFCLLLLNLCLQTLREQTMSFLHKWNQYCKLKLSKKRTVRGL